MLYQGSFNVQRSIFQWQYFQDGDMLKLWLWLVGNANIVPQEKTPFGRVERGQLAVSVATLELVTKLSPKKIRERLKKLEISGEIVMRKTNQFHVITICNYDKYQPQNFKKGKRTANERQADVEQTASQGQAEGITDGEQKATMIYNNTSNEDIIINTQQQNTQQKNCKNNFFKKGEKSFFEISEIKNQLDAENIFMTAAGYEEFKRNNESDKNNFNYNGGIPQAARFFLKKFPQFMGKPPKLNYKSLEVSAYIKKTLQSMQTAFEASEWKNYISLLKPVCDGDTLYVWGPSRSVVEHVRRDYKNEMDMLSINLQKSKIVYKF